MAGSGKRNYEKKKGKAKHSKGHKKVKQHENSNVGVEEAVETSDLISRMLLDLEEAKNRLVAENLAIRAEIAAIKLKTSEDAKALRLAQERERMAREKLTKKEEKINDLKRELEIEKQSIFEEEARLADLLEGEKQAELRLKQEMEEKEKAQILLEEEERKYKEVEEETKKRLEDVRQELEAEKQRHMDEIRELQQELAQLVTDAPPPTCSGDSSKSARASSSKTRLCLICREKQVNIVFLPCADQVICADCNSEAPETREDRCICCNVMIERRIQIRGPNM